jgi:hypothetical protein
MMSPEEAEAYHGWQVGALCEAGTDFVSGFTMKIFPNNSSGDGSFHGYGLDRGHLAEIAIA